MKINLCVMNDPDVLPMLHLFRTEAAIMFTSSVVFRAQCRHMFILYITLLRGNYFIVLFISLYRFKSMSTSIQK